MITEDRFLTFQAENTDYFNNKSVLVLIPHQDDESLGLGGTLSLIKDKVKKIDFCLVTDGSKSDKNITIKTRNDELEQVAKLLKIKSIYYLNYSDREVFYNIEKLKDELSKIVFNYDVIFSPTIFDIHPDHRGTAKSLLKLYSETKRFVPTFLYEVNIMQLFVNHLIDISNVIDNKIKMIKKYKSQLSLINYLDHILALNKTRVLSLKNIEYAEAFYLLKDFEEIKIYIEYCNNLNI